MLTIDFSGNWDLLRQVPSRFKDFVRRAPKIAAQEYAEAVHDWINAGNAFDKGTGILQQHIDWRPDGNDGLVYSNIKYAEFVEFGTGKFIGRKPWIITAKNRKALKFFDKRIGKIRFAKSVKQTGAKPFPFFFTDEANRLKRMKAEILDDLETNPLFK